MISHCLHPGSRRSTVMLVTGFPDQVVGCEECDKLEWVEGEVDTMHVGPALQVICSTSTGCHWTMQYSSTISGLGGTYRQTKSGDRTV
jgi:hypothetical protein